MQDRRHRTVVAYTRSSTILGAPVLSVSDQSPLEHAACRASFGSALQAIVSHRGVHAVAALWIGSYVIVLWLAHGSLPFDQPAGAHLPFDLQVAAPSIGLIEVFVLMALAILLTRKRSVPDMAARVPNRRVVVRETAFVLAYAALGQLGGWIVGPAPGFRPFSFHIAGSVSR